jgi:hypothetical protein
VNVACDQHASNRDASAREVAVAIHRLQRAGLGRIVKVKAGPKGGRARQVLVAAYRLPALNG